VGAATFTLLGVFGTPFAPAGTGAGWVLATTALMVVLWASEALPLGWTSLLPLLVFPFAGVYAGDAPNRVWTAASPYGDAYVLLFLGGLCIAAALQETGLHRRIAGLVLARTGASPTRLIAGVMLPTALVSMWISNTASAALLLPIVLSLMREIEVAGGPRPRYGAVLLLAVAFGANIGGMATKVGTATNMQLVGFLGQRGLDVTFAQFAFLGGGFVLLLLPIAVLLLRRSGRSDAPPATMLAGLRTLSLQVPPRLSPGERAVLIIFVATAVAWILAAPIRARLEPLVPFPMRTAHVEAGAALLAAITLALWRPRGIRLLTRSSLRAVPWSALLIIGGSFALAAGIEASGLSRSVAPLFGGLAGAHPLVQALIVALVTVATSAFLSNTATVGVLLPILAAAVPGANQTTVLFTSGLASSCDFALPAGTPPNAIVFATHRVPFGTMLRTGIPLDVIAAVLAALWCSLAVPWVLG